MGPSTGLGTAWDSRLGQQRGAFLVSHFKRWVIWCFFILIFGLLSVNSGQLRSPMQHLLPRQAGSHSGGPERSKRQSGLILLPWLPLVHSGQAPLGPAHPSSRRGMSPWAPPLLSLRRRKQDDKGTKWRSSEVKHRQRNTGSTGRTGGYLPTVVFPSHRREPGKSSLNYVI